MTHHLVGVAEIAEMLGVSRARVAQLAGAYEDFPEPEAELASGRIWSRTAVEAWIRDHPNRPGGRRPASPGPASGSFFDRLDEAAQQSIVLAQERARLLGHPRIGCEHLLLGLAQEQTGVAGQVLASVGADPTSLAEALESVAPARTKRAPGHLPFTDRAKRSLESSYRESLDLDSDVIRTEHILLGILTSGVNLAVQLLHEHLGIRPTDLRQAVVERASGSDPDRPADPATRTSERTISAPPGGDITAIIDRLDRMAARVDDRLAKIENSVSQLAATTSQQQPSAATGD